MIFIIPLGFKAITRIGANRSMVIGNFGNAIFFILLYALPHLHEPLWVLALARSVYSAFYFPAFTLNFIAARAHTRTGTQIGKLNAICLALNGLAPALGGIIAVRYGLGGIYSFVVAVIICANIPLLIGPDKTRDTNFNFRKIPWEAQKDFFANGIYNIPGFVESILWPVLISLFVASYATIGILNSIVVIITIIVSLYVGKKADEKGERAYLNEGVWSGAYSDMAKLFAITPLGIVGVNLLSGTSSALLANSFTSRYYKNADEKYALEYIFGMEFAHALIWTLFFSGLAILALFLSLKLTLLVGIALAIPSIFGVRMIRG